MRLVWSYGILLTLTGCVSSGQGIGGPGTYTYTDVLKPHGHERGEAAEQYATHICDQGNSDLIATPVFKGARLEAHALRAGAAADLYRSADRNGVPQYRLRRHLRSAARHRLLPQRGGALLPALRPRGDLRGGTILGQSSRANALPGQAVLAREFEASSRRDPLLAPCQVQQCPLSRRSWR